MATITTDTFLDGGVARTAGESWTVNGCKLTIRTDTRWHSNAPASMTGSLGGITISSTLGGEVYIDGTKVRWLAYDTGTGNVPAIGTTITQGGVSGYLLGVWANYTSAPTAVGAAMPASGFIKFREVTGGNYSAGALSGIGANATGADVRGWIEVVVDEANTINSTSLRGKFTAVGDWFYLENTTGSAGQVVQLPTNGGGTGTTSLGVQIETSPGSGVYEWFTTVNTTYWTTSYLVTDARAKCVESVGSGQIRIGANSGGTPIGFLPASGCKIRVPNIFLRSCTSAARASNVIPNATQNSRPNFASSLNVVLTNVSCEWSTSTSFTGSVNFTNTTLDRFLNTSLNTVILNDVALVQSSTNSTNSTVPLSDCILTLNKVKHIGQGSTPFAFTRCTGTITNCLAGRLQTTSSQGAVNIVSCSNLTITNFTNLGSVISLSGDNITVTNYDYVFRMNGDTTATSSQAISFSGLTNSTISGITFGLNGTLNNCQPYTTVISIGGNAINSNIKVRNMGTISSPISTGANASFYTGSFVDLTSSTLPQNCKFQRIYLTNFRSGFFTSTSAFADKCLFENIGATTNSFYSGGIGTDNIIRSAILGTVSTPTSSGMNYRDYFSSSTNTGSIFMNATATTTTSSPYVELSIANSLNSGLNATTAVLVTSGDYYIAETPYFILGHSSFQNVAPTIVATGSYSYSYQINTGSGYSAWKTLNAANLSAETISPSTGFKLKIRVTCTATSTSNSFTSIRIDTNSTSSDRNNFYPLDTAALSFTGLTAGTEVRCYTGTNPATSVEIGGVEATAGTTFSFTHSSGGVAGYIQIFALGYQPITIPYTYKSTDDSLLIQQVVDRNYVNPV